MFKPGILIVFLLILRSMAALADNERALSTEDRLYDLEAQVSTLKSELESTKKLTAQEKPNAFNPSISVVGDVVGQYGFNMKSHGHDHDHGREEKHVHDAGFANGVNVNEIEFEFRGEVDPFADALIALAIHPHGFSHAEIHLEEAYLRLKQWPGLGFSPLGMIIKGGRFKTAIGRINRVHRHNLPQIDYPLATKAFLGGEGYSADGLSLNLAFNPCEKTAINIFAEGIFNNRLPMQDEGAEKMPSAILHAWWHQELAEDHFLDVGSSALIGRKGKKGSGAFWLLGSDIHYSYIPKGYGQDPVFLLGNELYAANKNDTGGRWPIGNFSWAQVRLVNSTFFGVRYDIAPKPEKLNNMQHALGAYFTHYTTEFLRFRLGYEHVMPKFKSFDGDHRVMLSMVFVLGSHPIEPYFINR